MKKKVLVLAQLFIVLFCVFFLGGQTKNVYADNLVVVVDASKFAKILEFGDTFTVPAPTIYNNGEVDEFGTWTWSVKFENKLIKENTPSEANVFIPAKVGTYVIIYHCKNAVGDISTKEYTLNVKATIQPEINFSWNMTNYNFDWNGEASTQAEIKIPMASATDKYFAGTIMVDTPTVTTENDDKIAVSIDLENNSYKFTPKVQGKYIVTYYALSEKTGLSQTKVITLNIGDTDAPTLEWKDKENDLIQTVGVGSTWNFSFDMIVVEDNVDDMNAIINNFIRNGVTSSVINNLKPYLEIKMIKNGAVVDFQIVNNALQYTFNQQGDYTFIIKLTDTAGNTSGDEYSYTISAIKQNSSLPILKTINVGDSWIFKYSMIKVEDNVDDMQSLINSILYEGGYTLTRSKVEKLKKYVELIMIKDGQNIGYTIENNGLKYSFNTPGDYLFIIKLTDTSGNSSGNKYSYTISCQDVSSPELVWQEKQDILDGIIEVGKIWIFKFDMISVLDNVDDMSSIINNILKDSVNLTSLEQLKKYVDITMTKNGQVINYNIVDNGLQYSFDTIGDYVFTIKLTDNAGNSSNAKYSYNISAENLIKLTWKNIKRDLIYSVLENTEWTFKFEMIDVNDSFDELGLNIANILYQNGDILTSQKLDNLKKYIVISVEKGSEVLQYSLENNGLKYIFPKAGIYTLKIKIKDSYANGAEYNYEILIKSKKIEFLDSGVTIESENGINPKWNVKAEQIENKKISARKLKSAIKHDGKVSATFDISFSENNSPVEFDDRFIVSIDIPQYLLGKELRVVYISDDGKIIEDMNAIATINRKLVFSTTHFSHYAIIEVLENDGTKIVTIIISIISALLSITTIVCFVYLKNKIKN